MSSKYDYVKVKVHIGSSSDVKNYFILSRFLLSKMLLFCQIPANIAVRLALEVKKHFVDTGLLSVTEEALREELFATMRRHGFGDPYITLYRQLSEFQTARVPLVVFVGGTGCSGKSSIAHLLAAKFSNFHIINTDLVMETLHAIDVIDSRVRSHRSSSNDLHLTDDVLMQPVIEDGTADRVVADGKWNTSQFWFKPETAAEIVGRWEVLCKRVAQSIDGEIHKAFREGKAIIIEGTLLDLSLYAKFIVPMLQDEADAAMIAQQSQSIETRKPGRDRARGAAAARPIVFTCVLQLTRPRPKLLLENWWSDKLCDKLHHGDDSPPIPSGIIDAESTDEEEDEGEASDGGQSLPASRLPKVDVLEEKFLAVQVAHINKITTCQGASSPTSPQMTQRDHFNDENREPQQQLRWSLNEFVDFEEFDARNVSGIATKLHDLMLRRIGEELQREHDREPSM